MYFYVDESGNTGNNIFDANQPTLYYGLISSPKNLDIIAKPTLAQAHKKLGVTRIHSNELGNKGLVTLVDDLLKLQKQNDIRFDLYHVTKKDHAAICFFDQVFDSAMNPAVPWTAYWTPLRYFLLSKVHFLFNDELLKKAWLARLETNDSKAEALLVEVCEGLLKKTGELPDKRSQEIISGAFKWAIANPQEISYNASHKENAMQVSPNIVGFQQVMQAIARQTIKTGRVAKSIIVDQQDEFNNSQQFLANYYGQLTGQKFKSGPGLPQPDYSGMPQTALSFTAGHLSTGLEIVDIYLWVTKRILEDKPLAPQLRQLLYHQRHRGRTDEISIRAIEKRWGKWFADLPEPSDEKIEEGKKILLKEENKRKRVLDEIKYKEEK